MLKNKNKLLVVLIIILAIALIIVLFGGKIIKKEDNYSVVYLTTGEVYVGKLSLPSFTLADGYIFQVTKDANDPNKSNFQLNPIKDALWAPKSLHLIKDNIVFYGPLLPSSKIAETLAGQGK